MRAFILVVSVTALLFGGLWLIQGLGLVQVEPLLCFADCEPLQGPSVTWAVAGLALVTVGVLGILHFVRHRAQQ